MGNTTSIDTVPITFLFDKIPVILSEEESLVLKEEIEGQPKIENKYYKILIKNWFNYEISDFIAIERLEKNGNKSIEIATYDQYPFQVKDTILKIVKEIGTLYGFDGKPLFSGQIHATEEGFFINNVLTLDFRDKKRKTQNIPLPPLLHNVNENDIVTWHHSNHGEGCKPRK